VRLRQLSYIAYREMKRLEARIYERMAELSKEIDPRTRYFGFVTAQNFFGLDILPFAVEIAKVTMMIARKLAIDELHITEHRSRSTTWIKISSPPTPCSPRRLARPMAQSRRHHRQSAVSWRESAQAGTRAGLREHLAPRLRGSAGHGGLLRLLDSQSARSFAGLHPDDPMAGRAGLVGTQNIRNNQSRVGGLDYVVKTGTIVEAVENQPWSGEANVHVSIANWVKTKDVALLPEDTETLVQS